MESGLSQKLCLKNNARRYRSAQNLEDKQVEFLMLNNLDGGRISLGGKMSGNENF